jgi:hypothetical protein
MYLAHDRGQLAGFHTCDIDSLGSVITVFAFGAFAAKVGCNSCISLFSVSSPLCFYLKTPLLLTELQRLRSSLIDNN